MRLARFRAPDNSVWGGVVDGNVVRPLLPGDGHAGRWALVDLAMAHRRGDRIQPSDAYPLDAVRLLPPVPEPGAIRDFYAFEAHVATANKGRGREVPAEWYDAPAFYFTNPATVVGPDDEVHPPADTAELDYELEVACVVGRDLADVDADTAAAAIAGYTIFDDFSARDVQRREMKVGLGPSKGKDFANAFGPYLVTPDELDGGPSGRPVAAMSASVNGVERSRGQLGDVRWTFAEMIAHASRGSVVRRGDLVGSGTVGSGCLLELRLTEHAPPPWLEPGDTVELAVDGLGTLRNVVAGRGAGTRPRT